jgi:hypothetical protein
MLLHGDCLDLMGQLEPGSVDMILADLPYGTTACKWDTVIPFEPLWKHYRRLIKKNGAIVLTASQPFTSALVMSNPGWFRHRWAWIRGKRKAGFWDANRRPMRTFEDVLVFGPAPVTYNPQMGEGVPYSATQGHDLKGVYRERSDGEARVLHRDVTSRFPTDVLTFDPVDNRGRLHNTQKPVALMEYLIRTYTNEGETVLDNTCGSGTTGVACVNTGREFVGIEKDAAYFAIAEQRIAKAQADRAELLVA